MRCAVTAVALSLWSSFAAAATAASYLDLDLRENRYLGGIQQEAQQNSYTVFSGDLNLETQSPGFDYKLNPVMQGSFESQDETYLGVPEAYVQPRKIAPGFNLTIGRQKRVWSRLDQEFNLGVWQPQLRWDYLAPKQEGLVGVFFDWSLSSAVRLTFFTSPLFIPDQGPQFHLSNGQFSSSNRWFVQPQSRVQLFSNTGFSSDAPLYFELSKPPEEDIFMHSSFGFNMNYQSNGPLWSQLSYAYKPRNQIHLGIECANCANLGNGTPLEITAVIHPKVVNHNVITWETGFDRVDDRGWFSLTGDFPQRSGFPDSYAEAQLNTMLITGFAYQHYVRPWIGVPSWIEYSYMRVFEFRRRSENGLVPDDEVRSSLDRYPYGEIAAVDWRILLNQAQYNRLHWRNRYSYSIPERGGWLSSSLEWARGAMTWTLGLDILGAEVDPNSAEAGLFSRYRANDRVFGGVSYVF
jgi:hypothetical protein